MSRTSAHASASAAGTHALGRIWARFKTWRRSRAAYTVALRQYDELLDMPKHMLADMGLSRDMVREERQRMIENGYVDTDAHLGWR